MVARKFGQARNKADFSLVPHIFVTLAGNRGNVRAESAKTQAGIDFLLKKKQKKKSENATSRQNCDDGRV
jgi:hypothetical protein